MADKILEHSPNLVVKVVKVVVILSELKKTSTQIEGNYHDDNVVKF